MDVFASASESFGGAKDVSGIVDTATIKVMCYNCLVLAVNKKFPGKDVNSDPVKLIMSAKIKKLAVGTPEYVPAGKYAKLEMEDLKIWKKVSGKLIFANNVRQALAWLEAGEGRCRIYLPDRRLYFEKGQDRGGVSYGKREEDHLSGCSYFAGKKQSHEHCVRSFYPV